MLLAQEADEEDILSAAEALVSEEKEVPTPQDALQGAMDILAEQFAETAEIRDIVRTAAKKHGTVSSEKAKGQEDKTYEMYFDFPKPYIPCRPIGCWPCFGEKKKAR